MEEKLYSVNVSSLEIRKIPSQPSKIHLQRDTVVKFLGEKKQYKKEEWIHVVTVSKPTTSGFLSKKYLKRI